MPPMMEFQTEDFIIRAKDHPNTTCFKCDVRWRHEGKAQPRCWNCGQFVKHTTKPTTFPIYNSWMQALSAIHDVQS